MTQTKDKDTGESAVTTDHGSVGRVEVDSRGNSVWRWERKDGEGKEDTSILLKRLENQDLALEPTQKVPIARQAQPTGSEPGSKPRGRGKERSALVLDEPAGHDTTGGFDPYNSGR
jgi:hypothetical protein